MKELKCASLDGFDAVSINVEATFTKGLPGFSIVGLASSSIQESKDRIKSSLLVNEFKFPPLKITVNLSPSELAKSGSHFDLTIALLIALQNEKVDFDDFYVFGELGLDGSLKDTKSIFVLVLSLAQQGLIKNVLVPKESAEKISAIPDIDVYAVDNLFEAIEFFNKDSKSNQKIDNSNFNHNYIKIDDKKYYYKSDYQLDFEDVKGQTIAKKAALIAAAGDHNILYEGSPGCGKSMITKRLRYILAPMSLEEILEKAKLDSLDGKEPDFSPTRVFRSPHHSSTKASIFGGGSSKAKIGEVALANNGLLFFDELPHFGKTILEALREPLEDYKILISRVNSKVEYPSKFIFVSAMNPCPCGNLLSSSKECRCSDIEVQRYKNRLSDPFLDRIDLYVTMNEVSSTDKADISSRELHQKVINTFAMQKQRGQENLNGKLSDEEIKRFCSLNSDCQLVLDQAVSSFALSFRSINKILKVARTIADLENSKTIKKAHLLESFSYRKR